MNEFVKYHFEIALKLIYGSVHLFWLTKSVYAAMAEWSRASDHFRSFDQKLEWGPGNFFFFSKKKF